MSIERAPVHQGCQVEDASEIHPPPARLFKEPFPTPHVTSIEEYQDRHERSLKDPEIFWKQEAQKVLHWEKSFTKITSGGFEKGDVKWFEDGELCPFYNIVGRHAERTPDSVALIYEPDHPDEINTFKTHYTYQQLADGAKQIAQGLLSLNVKKGDVVAIHMVMIPHAIMSMLACTYIGAIHSVVFAGFGHHALAERIQDGNCKVVITIDEGMRGGKHIPIKKIINQALESCPLVTKVLVFSRSKRDLREEMSEPKQEPQSEVVMVEGRDIWWQDLRSTLDLTSIPPPVINNAEDILFVLYTSGSTGRPKGMVHTTAGYLLGAAMTTRDVFDVHTGDRFACMADIGWITGHTYTVYGPLLLGVTTLQFESTPTYPTPNRYFQVLDRHKITQLYLAPTVVRILRDFGGPAKDLRNKYLRDLRVLGSVGEPINPEAWDFYHKAIGGSECPISDSYWQTETGSIVITPLPCAIPTRPGCATVPFWGIEPAIIDRVSRQKLSPGHDGFLVLQRPWPSIARTIWGDHDRYMKTYFHSVPGAYFTGDHAIQDRTKGYYWIRGRVDDVMNIAGHRVSTAEIEASALQFKGTIESAVVGIPDEKKGEAIVVFLVHGDPNAGPGLTKYLRENEGAIITPAAVHVVPALPKTRSGKIMRRILRKIACDDVENLGDVSTLANPESVQQIVSVVTEAHQAKRRKVVDSRL